MGRVNGAGGSSGDRLAGSAHDHITFPILPAKYANDAKGKNAGLPYRGRNHRLQSSKHGIRAKKL